MVKKTNKINKIEEAKVEKTVKAKKAAKQTIIVPRRTVVGYSLKHKKFVYLSIKNGTRIVKSDIADLIIDQLPSRPKAGAEYMVTIMRWGQKYFYQVYVTKSYDFLDK